MEAYGVNCFTISGRLTKDPQFNTAANGNTYASFSIAKNFFVPNKKNQTIFIDCYAYGTFLINAIQNNSNYKRGASVIISGQVQGYSTRVNESDNETIATLKMSINSITHVEFPKIANSNSQESEEENSPFSS